MQCTTRMDSVQRRGIQSTIHCILGRYSQDTFLTLATYTSFKLPNKRVDMSPNGSRLNDEERREFEGAKYVTSALALAQRWQLSANESS